MRGRDNFGLHILWLPVQSTDPGLTAGLNALRIECISAYISKADDPDDIDITFREPGMSMSQAAKDRAQQIARRVP